VGFIARLDRFYQELHKSASSGVSEMNAFDQKRLQSYIDALRALKKHQEEQPQLDLPESHGAIVYAIEDLGDFTDVENESINDALRLMKVLRHELVNSQSSRVASGYNKHDSMRVDSVVSKLESLLKNYIQIATPLDMPESSPKQEQSGAGNQGI